MLDKKWLSEYHTKDLLEHKSFFNNIRKPKLATTLKYPPESRLKINSPCSFITSSNIWSQIPLYATSIIGIPPWSRDELIRTYGWGTEEDFEHLAQLARWGRVQFHLTASALDYVDCDHLESILTEFQPPFLYESGIIDLDAGDDKIYYDEFIKKADIAFIPILKEIYYGKSERFIQKRIDDYAVDYVVLKKIGYDEIADKIYNNLDTDPQISNAYCTIFGNLIVVPLLNPLITS